MVCNIGAVDVGEEKQGKGGAVLGIARMDRVVEEKTESVRCRTVSRRDEKKAERAAVVKALEKIEGNQKRQGKVVLISGT